MNEQNFWNKVYYITEEYGKELVGVVKYISDAIAMAKNVEYSVTGKVIVEGPAGNVEFEREIE